MMITERLKVEHGVFLEQLRFLETLLEQKAPLESLAIAVETLARAEELHDELEDKVLYPALAKVLASEHGPLQEVNEQHVAIRAQFAHIREGGFSADDVRELIQSLRSHMEKEIHLLFPMAEELLPEATLISLCRWDEEHVYLSAGRRAEWSKRLDRT